MLLQKSAMAIYAVQAASVCAVCVNLKQPQPLQFRQGLHLTYTVQQCVHFIDWNTSAVLCSPIKSLHSWPALQLLTAALVSQASMLSCFKASIPTQSCLSHLKALRLQPGAIRHLIGQQGPAQLCRSGPQRTEWYGHYTDDMYQAQTQSIERAKWAESVRQASMHGLPLLQYAP